jgi:hypothetical protein
VTDPVGEMPGGVLRQHTGDEERPHHRADHRVAGAVGTEVERQQRQDGTRTDALDEHRHQQCADDPDRAGIVARRVVQQADGSHG